MRQYKGYFFDLYGTLVDIHTDESRPAFWRDIAEWYHAHGADYDSLRLRRDYLNQCAKQEALLQKKAPAGALTELELSKVFADLFRLSGLEPSTELIQETASFFRRKSTTHLRCYAGAGKLLNCLREAGRKVVLLSNAQACFTRRELEELNLIDCFDHILISSEVGYRKPDPRFFQAGFHAVQLDPSDCLMIGNDPICDVGGANQVGMDAFYIHSALSPQPRSEENHAAYSLPYMDLAAVRRILCPGRNIEF